MTIPEHQSQDSYVQGVDLVREISSECGSSQVLIRQQIVRSEITLDDELWEGDKFFIPYEKIKGKKVVVAGPDRHWQFQYRG